MATKNTKSTTKFDPDHVEVIELSRIFADRSWNSRSAVENDSTDADGKAGNKGWIGLVCSLATSPQRDPVTLRPNPDFNKKKGEPGREFLLVAGFQRHDAKLFTANGANDSILVDPDNGAALTQAEANALHTKNPTIRAFVKDLTEAEARAENLAENMQRNSLSGPDIAYGVMRLRKADPSLSDVQVAIILNQNQPYVSRLKRIAEGTKDVIIPAGKITKDSPPVTILEAWREAPRKLNQTEMLAIASEADEDKKVSAYVTKASNKVASSSSDGEGTTTHRGPGTWAANAAEKHAPVIGTMLGTLVRMGVISIDASLEGKDIITAVMAPNCTVRENATPEQIGMIAGALQRAMDAAVKAKPAKKDDEKKPARASANGKHVSA